MLFKVTVKKKLFDFIISILILPLTKQFYGLNDWTYAICGFSFRFFLFSLFLWASLNRNWNNIDLTTEMRRHFKTILLYMSIAISKVAATLLINNI